MEKSIKIKSCITCGDSPKIEYVLAAGEMWYCFLCPSCNKSRLPLRVADISDMYDSIDGALLIWNLYNNSHSEILSSCPWCGEDAVVDVIDMKCGPYGEGYYVECSNDGCAVHPTSRKGRLEDVIKDWNTRMGLDD